jgi:hypothetical protein
MTHTEVTARPFETRIIARNSAAESRNNIHADDGAQAMGFKAALVPGNALYCYLETAIRGSLGPDWTERGAADVRFIAPVHDGDQLRATATPRPGGGVEVALIREENGQVAESGTAWLRSGDEAPPRAADYPLNPLPDSPVPFTEEWALDIGQFGSLDLTVTREDVAEYLAGMGQGPDTFGADVPSAFLARMYAKLMSSSVVRSGPSIHAASQVSQFKRVEFGEPLSVRGYVDRLYGRRGNRYSVLDIAYLNEAGEVVMAQHHTAIYRLRKRNPSA